MSSVKNTNRAYLTIQFANYCDSNNAKDRIIEYIDIYGRCTITDLEYIIADIEQCRIVNRSILLKCNNFNEFGWNSKITWRIRKDRQELYYLDLPCPKNLSIYSNSFESESNERNSETEESLFESIEVNGLEVCSMRKNVRKIRLMFRDIETAINDICPERSRDKSIGLTELENAYMRFSQAIVKANK